MSICDKRVFCMLGFRVRLNPACNAPRRRGQ